MTANSSQDPSSSAHGKLMHNNQNASPGKPASERSEEKDVRVEQLEDVRPVRTRFGRRTRARNHCAKFWLWWLIGVIVFLAIFLPCL